ESVTLWHLRRHNEVPALALDMEAQAGLAGRYLVHLRRGLAQRVGGIGQSLVRALVSCQGGVALGDNAVHGGAGDEIAHAASPPRISKLLITSSPRLRGCRSAPRSAGASICSEGCRWPSRPSRPHTRRPVRG